MALGPLCLYWDLDAPATLDRLRGRVDEPLRRLVLRSSISPLPSGGGDGVCGAYEALGARHCLPIYHAVDPSTHHPVAPQIRFLGDLALLANRQPDREALVDELFLRAAASLPRHRFRLGGSGWSGKRLPDNVDYIGWMLRTGDLNAFNGSPLAVLDVNGGGMARATATDRQWGVLKRSAPEPA